jgi:hypothetical protein
MPQENTWAVDLGVAIGVQARIVEVDPEQTFSATLPELKASETSIAEYESETGERLPASYRDFLLHANGWDLFYFTLDLFGLQQLRGAGRWKRAQDLLETYEAEDVLDDSDLDAADLLPVAAGPGTDLVVVVREGRPNAGMTVWFDDFGDFFEHTVAMMQNWVDRHSN